MRKIFFYMMTAITMLFVSSCQNEIDPGSNVGETSMVSLKVSTPEILSRSYSDGQTATVLQYAVYDSEGNILDDLTKTNGSINGNTTVNLQLTTGNTYSVIFWAAAENAPYTINFTSKTMTVDYEDALSNDESRDAFYKYHTFTVQGAQTETIELKRPFAQLNIGTSDYSVSASAGYKPEFSSVTVKKIYNTLNFADGTVSGETEVTFDYSTIPSGETFPVNGYEYLAMNYLLVPVEKEVIDIEFGYTKTDATAAKIRTVGSVPVQRNYRTNIYGELLTSDVNINVEIKPEYDGEYNNEHLYYVEEENTYYITSIEGFNLFAEKVNNGNAEWANANIALDGDVDLSVVASRSASSWTSIGTSENPFKGTFDGKGYSIKNLNIVETEAKEGKAYIGFFGYAKDVTIKNVTFENVNVNIPCLDIDHSQGHIGAVVGSLEGTSTIENVTVKGDIKVEATFDANGASRVAVVAGGNAYGNVTMKNVHIIANEGSYVKANNNTGALAGQFQGVSVFENCSSNIDVTVKKFFAGGIIGLAAGNQKFTNCHTTGDVKVLAGREGRSNDHYRVGGIAGGWGDNVTTPLIVENCSYTGEVSGTNTDGSVAEPLDYMGYVGRGYTLTNRAGSTVIIDGVSFVQKYNDQYGIYDVYGADGSVICDTEIKLKEALSDGNNVSLTNDLKDVTVNTTAPYGNYYGVALNGGVLNGNGHTLDFDLGELKNGKADNYGIMTSGGTIKNVTITGVFRGIMIMNPTEDLYIDNVTIGDKDVCYAINTGEGDGTHSLYVSNSTIKGWNSYGTAIKDLTFTKCTFAQGEYYDNVSGRLVKPYVNAVFDGCEFNSKYYIDLSALTEGSKVTLKNCTVNGVKLTANNWKELIVSEENCKDGQISVELKDGSYLSANNIVDYIVFE